MSEVDHQRESRCRRELSRPNAGVNGFQSRHAIKLASMPSDDRGHLRFEHISPGSGLRRKQSGRPRWHTVSVLDDILILILPNPQAVLFYVFNEVSQGVHNIGGPHVCAGHYDELVPKRPIFFGCSHGNQLPRQPLRQLGPGSG